MLIGLGIDIINIKRVKKIIDRWGEKYLKRVFTEREINYCLSQPYPEQHFAVRFSAKEAVFKALGTGRRNINWREIEIINDSLGKPQVFFRDKAENMTRERYIKKVHISLSHEEEYAVAQVVIEGGKKNDYT